MPGASTSRRSAEESTFAQDVDGPSAAEAAGGPIFFRDAGISGRPIAASAEIQVFQRSWRDRKRLAAASGAAYGPPQVPGPPGREQSGRPGAPLGSSVMPRFDLKDSDYSFNASLDPFLVLKRMGFTESSIYQEGSIVRIHCPIHKDLVRKSMIIDTAERTFKCQYSQCDAYEGGLLIELVAMYYDCGLDEVTKNLFGDDDKSNDMLFRGEMYINKGMHEEALPYLEQAVQLDPRNEITRSKLAALYLELNRKDDAFREYMLAAESFAVRGELEKTLSIYNILIILQPGAVKARKELAFLFSRMGRPDAAADQLKWVVDFYMQYGQVRGAQETIQAMLELDDSNGMSHYISGEILSTQGKKGPAGQAYERAAELFLEAREPARAQMAIEASQTLTPFSPKLKVLQQQYTKLVDEIGEPQRDHDSPLPGDGGPPPEDFELWLNEAEERLGEFSEMPTQGISAKDLVAALGPQSPQAGNLKQLADQPFAAETPPDVRAARNESGDISPEDRRVELCLNDMKGMTPAQLEKMRQQLVGMFTDVRKSYDAGDMSDWEMKTIKEFYKAFCVAVDQHRRRESPV